MNLSGLAEKMQGAAAALSPRVPKYVLLSDSIVGAVDAGDLKPGDQLPGEHDLAAALPASLGTIQKALGRLVEQGVVIRRHGSGTFVADQSEQLPDLWHFRFRGDDGHTLLPVFSRVQSIRATTARGHWSDFLSAARSFIRIEREIDVNGEFYCLGRLYLDAEPFHDLLKMQKSDLDNINIRALLRQDFGVATVRIEEQVGAETFAGDVCKALALAVGTTGLACHILGYGFRDAAVSYQMVYLPPHARRLEIRPRGQ
ncbi:MAG: GntR family transcriptional regulator [Rhodospirillales bacterium]|nr:GntR family transcriptional regulator [Rhodospirillales bacterium]